MPLLPWAEKFELGYEPMDRTHREFVDLVNALAEAADADLPARLDAFVAHTEAHFAEELRWMLASGFPPIHCHETEHAEVLKIAAFVREQVAAGDVALGRVLAREMGPWFEHHAATMDAALAQWIRQTHWADAARPSRNP